MGAVIALMPCPFLPLMKTDCLALLRIDEGGLASAIAATNPLARMWSRIGSAMGGSVRRLVEEGLLIWMPVHQASAAIGIRFFSKDKKLF